MRTLYKKINVLNLKDFKTKYITAYYNNKRYSFCCFGLCIDNEIVFEVCICNKKITKIVRPKDLYNKFLYELVIKQWFMDNEKLKLNDLSDIEFEIGI